MARKNTELSALQLIKSGAAVCRADLVRELNISPSTASNIVRTLIAQDVIAEVTTQESTGGRPAKFLTSLTPADIIAVAELGEHHIRYALLDRVDRLVGVQEIVVHDLEAPAQTIDKLLKLWDDLRQQLVPHSQIKAYGISVPAPINSSSQRIVLPARLPGWHDADLRELLRQKTGCPAWIENDARAAAYGEISMAKSGSSTFIYVKAGSGIGAAFVVNGAVFSGASGIAGDIAHIRVSPNSDIICACGKNGCLETEASGASLRRKAQALGINLETMNDLVEASFSQANEVISLVREAGELIGRSLSPLVNFINPDAVIVGGSLSGVGVFMSSLKAALFTSASSSSTSQLRIEAAGCGPDSALLGVAQKAFALL